MSIQTWDIDTDKALAVADEGIDDTSMQIDGDARVVETLSQVKASISRGQYLTSELKTLSHLLVEQAVRVGKALSQLRALRKDIAREKGLRPPSFELFAKKHFDIPPMTMNRYIAVAAKFGNHLETRDDGTEALPPAKEWPELGLPDSLKAAYKMVSRERHSESSAPMRRISGPPAYIKSARALTADLTKHFEVRPLAEMDDGEKQGVRDALAPIRKVIEMLG